YTTTTPARTSTCRPTSTPCAPIPGSPTRTTTWLSSTSAAGASRTPCATWRSSAASRRSADGRPRGARAGRHLGLQLPRLARQLLPRRAPGARDAPLLRARARHRGDQPHLPPPAHAGAAHGLGAPDADRLPLRLEGPAAHHPRAAPARCGRDHGGVLSRRHGARPEAGPAPLPAP